MRRVLRGSGALLALVATIVVLHAMAQFDLRGPTGVSSDELSTWFEDPTLVIATILRWLALFLAYYLAAVVLALTVFAERLEDGPLGHLVPSWVAATAGVILGVSAVGVPLAVHMNSSDAPQTSEPAAPLALHELDEPLTLDPLDADINADADGGHPAITATVKGAAVAAEDRDALWTVRSGDSFWSIAEETLLDERDGADISESDVAAYWRIVIAANQDRLIEPGNPDLIMPGQELVLPPIG